ncbi:Uncharacterised protein [Chryseobacterium nakagawai]|uniref:YD repeat-containing protein n=1 Tax=Chryseobacterium nakagawai TaxID=1241982 RepID=A0AAD0YQ11_CHRNA|nr:hypothetical protein [Chryseobacterium nakagawai]AZA92488.1 hypothetical protein EG343_18720 [Chryseobacterium nakagawai]VEH19066.1 Uncharacterised protein [Chryseobacterium nakagawai]
MKKIIFLASALSAVMGWGQTSIGGEVNLQKIIPTTPETYSMFKAGDFPVDYRTGKLNVSVPLHTISTKSGISIPISLTYNTGGIKVDETSSTVGLGWTLSIPNSISVEIHGKEDLNSSSRWFPSNIYDYQYTSAVNFETFPTEILVKLQAIRDDAVDTEPDIYHYSLPTISGSFTRDTNGNFHTIPYDNIKISYSDMNNEFTIIDPQGIIYTLKVGNSLSLLNTSPFAYRASFLLDKITFPNKEEIIFKYDKYMSYKSITHGYTDLYYPIPIAFDPCVAGQKNIHTATTNRYIDKLPTEIIYNNEILKFNYTNTINGATGRKDIFTDTPENTYALDEITVVDNQNNKIIKNLRLVHDYFTSSDIITSAYRNYRLKLLRVENLLENSKYSFDYNEKSKPSIGSYSQDIWGYYNGKGGVGLIPNMHYFNRDYTEGADRSVDPVYTQAYILKKITYPTGGSSAFSYENNTVWAKLIIPKKEETIYNYINNSYTNDQNEYDNILMTTPSNEYFYIDVNPVDSDEQLWVEFLNSCSNQIPNEIPENGSSMGMAYIDEFVNNQWKNLSTFSGTDVIGPLKDGNGAPANNKFFLNPQAPKRIRVRRMGNCSTSLKISKIKYVNEIINQNNIVGGLRIKSIEDFDGTANYTKRQFQYHNPTLAGEQSSGSFASPLKFLSIIPREVEFEGKSLLCNMYGLSADQAINSSLLGKDVVNYKYVTEHTLGKGKKDYQFIAEENELNLSNIGNGFNPFRFINKNLINEKFYTDNGTNPIKEIIYNYSLTYSKNALSSNSYGNPLMIAPYGKIIMIDRNVSMASGGLYSTQVLESYPIESGKFLLDETVTKDYINGSEIITKVNNNYSIDNIQNPINLLKQSVTYGNSNNANSTETSYQYAHEKNNQKLINANMVGIPLETSVLQKKNVNDPGNITSKTETKYDDPTTLFPTSVLSYNLQNPSLGSTELSYDKYDSKGNIVQYTNRAGVSTVIIWGYNQTQPIAKIENAKLEGIGQPFIDSIVNASNLDAAAERNNDETNLHNAFKDFRNNLSGYQITTYSYDPLIGVRSITPPSGIREVYLYDAAGRLKEVREHNNTGKLLKEFNYHYKN